MPATWTSLVLKILHCLQIFLECPDGVENLVLNIAPRHRDTTAIRWRFVSSWHSWPQAFVISE